MKVYRWYTKYRWQFLSALYLVFPLLNRYTNFLYATYSNFEILFFLMTESSPLFGNRNIMRWFLKCISIKSCFTLHLFPLKHLLTNRFRKITRWFCCLQGEDEAHFDAVHTAQLGGLWLAAERQPQALDRHAWRHRHGLYARAVESFNRFFAFYRDSWRLFTGHKVRLSHQDRISSLAMYMCYFFH